MKTMIDIFRNRISCFFGNHKWGDLACGNPQPGDVMGWMADRVEYHADCIHCTISAEFYR